MQGLASAAPRVIARALHALRSFVLLMALVLAGLAQAESAAAQTLTQGWAGIVPGSGDYANPVPYRTPGEACNSYVGSYVPAFGYTVYNVIAVNPWPDGTSTTTGEPVPLTECVMNAGAQGTGHIISAFGCDSGNKAANGTCVPSNYPATAEPICKGNTGTPGACPTRGDPVSLSSGAKVEVVTDYSSGGPYPIEIKRYYRSFMMPISTISDGMGVGWRTDLVGRQVDLISSAYDIMIRREDGSRSRFINPNSDYSTPGPWKAYSVETTNYGGNSGVVATQVDATDKFTQITQYTNYQYTDENDRVDTINNFSGNYRVVQSTWKGGYQRNYTYDGAGHVVTITDSLNRTLTLTWTGNVISSVTAPDGTKIQYTYTQQVLSGAGMPGTELLTQVARYTAAGALIDQTSYQYDRTSSWTPLLTSVTDTNGAVVESTTYDSLGRALSAQRAGGADAITIAYDDTARTRTVTNALGQVEVYTMRRYGNTVIPSVFETSSISRQASATVPAASQTQAYDTNGFVAQRVDWNGSVTNYTNDATGNETQRVEDAMGTAPRTISTTWSSTFRLPTQIVAPNLTVNFTYDTAGRLTQRKETDTSARNGPVRIWNYVWNTNGTMASVTGPRTDLTQTTSYTYDANGNLATVTDALNHVTTITSVDGAGRPLSVRDTNGVVTNLAYDPLGRVLTSSVQGPTPATTSFTYDVNGNLISVTQPNGVALTYGYDGAYRLTSISDSMGDQMAFTLDAMGNRTGTQVLNGSAQVLMTNSATFDTLGRLLTSIGAANQTTSYQYDANGNLTKLIDPRNASTQRAFDGLNRVKQITDALNGVTLMARDGQDNVTSLTDPKSNATTYTVNGFGFVTQVTSPDSGATTFTYDLAGNVTSRKDARKVVTNYTYDALDRLKTRTYPSDTTQNVTMTYDETTGGNYGVGRLTSLVDAAGTASFTYDVYGNQVAEKRTMGGIQYVTGYAYDLAGAVTKITYPSGFIVNYQRDSLGRVSGVTTQANSTAQPVTVAANISYLPFGPLQALTLGNGVQKTNSFDLDYRLTGTQAGSLQNLSFSYDGQNNITAATDAVSANLSQTFQYDLLGRLTNGVGFYGNDTYTYDAVGNRLTRALVNGTTTSTSYSYTAGKTQLASRTTGGVTLSYTYDADGNRTALKQGNTTQASYTYNADGRLLTTGTATALKYDAFGRRLIETVSGGGTHYLFQPNGLLLAEHTTTGALTRNYVYLNGEPLALVDASGAISYLLNDQLGQPLKMLNASATVTWQRVPGIFGDTVSQPIGTTSSNPLRFPGQQYDVATSLHYNYFRDYDPAVGRYIEADPTGLAGGLNVYGYALGNPVGYYDPSGLRPLTAGEIAFLRVVYNCKVDYRKVDVHDGAGIDPRTWAPVGTGNAVTLENNIYFPSSGYQSDFSKADLSFQAWLVHETGHVYQYQNDSSYSWSKAAAEGLRGDTYQYNLDGKRSFGDYRYEQQAEMLADYYRSLVRRASNQADFEKLLSPMGLGKGGACSCEH